MVKRLSCRILNPSHFLLKVTECENIRKMSLKSKISENLGLAIGAFFVFGVSFISDNIWGAREPILLK